MASFAADDIVAALTAAREGYKEFPPTLPQFIDLCRNAQRRRAQDTKQLASPHTDMPEKIRQIIREFVAKHA